MRIKNRCQGEVLAHQAQHHAPVGGLLPGPKLRSPQEMVLLHKMHWHSVLLCSRFEGVTGTHPEHCYATFIPNLEHLMNFLVKNYSAWIYASRNIKKLGMLEQSLKMNQRGHQGGGKFD